MCYIRGVDVIFFVFVVMDDDSWRNRGLVECS